MIFDQIQPMLLHPTSADRKKNNRSALAMESTYPPRGIALVESAN
jgi:hypothetical protein